MKSALRSAYLVWDQGVAGLVLQCSIRIHAMHDRHCRPDNKRVKMKILALFFMDQIV